MMHVYNTLGRVKEPLIPRVPGQIGLYVCGITVYDHLHVGHARALLVYDVLYRHLLASGLDVTFVRNITDVDDKIIARANANGETPDALAQRFIDAMHEDAQALGALSPTHEPRAMGYIDKVVSMIERLIESGHAYAIEGGDVLYAVRSFSGYGKLSGRRPDELRSGARIATDERKRDPLDFALWKASREDEPSWPSPWGDGRPGWHIECSAMSTALLGDEFDIHGGGLDLEFPHHENEIAQSEAATGKRFARYWMHNGLVRVDGEKMSKSIGNFMTVRDALAEWRGEEIRFFVIASHYRSPVDYSDDALTAGRTALRGLYTALRGHVSGATGESVDTAGSIAADNPAAGGTAAASIAADAVKRFTAAMNDDLNTPLAIAALHELAGAINREEDADSADMLARTLRDLGGRLGLLQEDPEAVLQGQLDPNAGTSLSSEAIDALIDERRVARAEKDFARGDAIRDELTAAGITLEDADGRTIWRRS